MTDPVIPPHDSAAPPTTLSISAKDLSDAGLEPQLRSWIGSGANEPITDEQIAAVVGKDRLARTAESLGREPGELAAALAADLPRVIDTASPDGRIEPIRAQVRAAGVQTRAQGSVHAYIEGGPASLTNGTDAIALTTTFNNVVLTATPQEVVDDPQSAPGTQADLFITAAKPTATQSGLYSADFTVVFDAVPRV